ncbi:restriction endonuclease [Neptunomonas sp. XY-337]|uniref:restriction endonuclease n=1 Tax=Neptunomonas sp. XY-337 TaxID=2561897 RepID=UPI0010AA2E9E|nr:restriction endonuclease [Neptunomonas sp. XY-337]
MKIEVACEKNEPNKAKGDLFEKLSRDLLEAQGYDVIEEIRVTGVELDLLCKHKVSQKEVYVECKAQKEKINAPILTKLIGTVITHDYQEGWLVSTSEYGKDAQGLVDKWSRKSVEESSKYSFYTPSKVIEALRDASVITAPPIDRAVDFMGDKDLLGSWTLLISKYGRYWAVYTLKAGTPDGVLLYSAQTGKHIQAIDTISNISKLESTIADYDLTVGQVTEDSAPSTDTANKLPNVVEVQTGDSWDDYRPARPKDFVGRDDLQKEILTFLGNAKDKTSTSRIFAITGNSGLGKSSLIAKVRDRSRNQHYRKKYFVYAVDIRGAKSPSYISASLLKALREAQKAGFGSDIPLQLNDPNSPLASDSIQSYLDSVAKEQKVVCLVCDQFEELYSKPELFNVFTAAQDLMIDVAAFKGNLVLGFAWKTDSTTHQDHPAYHMWHNLADLRREYRLDLFDSGEISKSITTFEKEFDHKVVPEIRHQISYSCQGFPWLLKKLCINLRESYKKGNGTDLSLVDLDVGRLFDTDIELLTASERTCLDLIANKAPADWSEIIELSSVADVSNLVNKRMVIRSGDRLNIYWDIFKDYLVTGKVPVIPYNFIPTSDFVALMNVAKVLNNTDLTSAQDISSETGLNERTVLNVGADLVMLGIAERKGSSFKIHHSIQQLTEFSALDVIRQKFAKHSLKLSLFKNYSGKIIDHSKVVDALKDSLPKASHSEKTWNIYARRLVKYFQLTGFLVKTGAKYVVQDTGVPTSSSSALARRRKGKQKSVVFAPPVSPFIVQKAFSLLEQGDTYTSLEESGYRNALTVLKRFEMIIEVDGEFVINHALLQKHGGSTESIWTSTKNEQSMIKCIEKLSEEKLSSGTDYGKFISDEFNLDWSEGTMLRGGNSLKQWSAWIKEGIEQSKIPPLPGRSKGGTANT